MLEKPPTDEGKRRQEDESPPPCGDDKAVEEVTLWLGGASVARVAKQYSARDKQHRDDVREADGKCGG